jgi:hypothetical protein
VIFNSAGYTLAISSIERDGKSGESEVGKLERRFSHNEEKDTLINEEYLLSIAEMEK